MVAHFKSEARGKAGEILGRIALETLLVHVDKTIRRTAPCVARFGRVRAPLAQSIHLLRQVDFLAALGFNDVPCADISPFFFVWTRIWPGNIG
jgi:hypothetical protein